MKDDQFIQLMTVLKPGSKDEKGVSELIFKGISTLSFALIAWTLTTVQSLKTEVAVINQENKNTKEIVEDFSDFTHAPRFTRGDFDLGMQPFIKQLNTNTTELNSRNSFMSETEGKFIKIDMQIEELNRKIDNYK